MDPRHFVAVLVLLVLLLPQSTCAGQQQQQQQASTLQDTVAVTGTHSVGQLQPGSSTTVIDCSKLQGRPAFLVRQGSLLLQNVVLKDCRHQAIVLIGPGASLTARNVTLSGHGSSSSTVQGAVISAEQASANLEDVIISGSSGALPHGLPAYAPACNSTNAEQSIRSSSSSGGGAVCGAPIPISSLVSLQDSTFRATNSRFVGNTAGALISAAGSAQHSVQLLQGTQLQDNTAAWLVLADSFAADPVGRENLLAPHPSEENARQKLRFRPIYTTHDFAGPLKSLGAHGVEEEGLDWRQALPANLARPKMLRYVGVAPQGQSPLQVRLAGCSISHNTVTGGLLWLRLVNTSMQAVNITSNVALAAAPAAATAASAQPQAAAAAKAAARQATAALAAGGTLPSLQPPWLCDMEAMRRALIVVEGPAAFDMLRCNVSHNVNPAGAILRIADGVSLASIRSSSLSSNIATAVLRMDGRSWVHDAIVFLNATQAIDAGFFRIAEATSEQSYKTMLLPALKKQQLAYDKAVTDTAAFVTDTRFEHNAVFHAVVLVKGERADWRKYEAMKAKAIAKALADKAAGRPADAKAVDRVTMHTFNAISWWSGNSFSHNRFIPATGKAAHQGFLPEAAQYVNALSFVLSASLDTRADWSANSTTCQSSVKEGAAEATPKTYNIKPAVVAATFGTHFIADSFANSSGFPHVLSMHSVTFVGSLQMRHNVAGSSVLRIIDATASVLNSTLASNQVQGGSVLQGDSFKGHLEEVAIIDNSAANADAASNSSRTAPATAAGAGAGASADGKGATWGIVGLLRLDLGVLRHVTVRNNSAPFWTLAMEFVQWNFLEDVVNLTISHNSAGGVRLKTVQPYYDRQGWVMRNSRIINNTATAEAGALRLEGFSTRVGTVMPITLERCVLAHNRPAPGAAITPKGGGIAIEAPSEDKADGSSDRGFLETINITIADTLIEGNMAQEGGGVWSAWPMLMRNTTIRGNTAQKAGGGIFLRGLQQDKVGRGNVIIRDSTITNNTAAFGGAVACDSCRAVFLDTSMSNNTAALQPLEALVGNGSNSTCGTGSGSSLATKNGTCTATAVQPQQQPTAADAQMGTVLGAGGAVAAVLQGRSFLRVCGGSAGKAAAMTDNTAATTGGLVFLNQAAACGSSGASSGCDASAIRPFDLVTLCGVQLHAVDCSGARSNLSRGHVLGWTGGSDRPDFSMPCSSAGGGSDNSSTSASGFCGCGEASAAPNAGLPAAGAAEWQLPSQMSVLNSSCLAALVNQGYRNNSAKLQECLLARSSSSHGTQAPGAATAEPASAFTLPRAVAGDAVSITISLARGSAALAAAADAAAAPDPCADSVAAAAANSSSDLAVVQLQQDTDGELFVIGKATAAVNRNGTAHFCDLALQPVSPPRYNRQYSFSLVPNTSSGLLAQVQPVTVTVQLLRCTLGQHMTVNRCVRCAELGTFSLNPDRPCQPCVPGGLCSKGLLQPQDGFWSANPFVPQIIPCPLKGACADRPISSEQMATRMPRVQPEKAQEVMAGAQQQQQQQQQNQRHGPEAQQQNSTGPAAGGRRQLLQPRAAAAGSRSDSSGGGSSSGGQAKQPSRAQALQQYSRQLAELITFDPEEGPFKLYNVTYGHLLHNWQQLQCNTGYKGILCATCDPEYVDPSEPSSSSSASQPRRFALHRNRCVDCSQSWGASLVLLFLLFLLFLANVGLGIFAQINSIDAGDKALLNSRPQSSSRSTRSIDGKSGSGSARQQLPSWLDCWQAGRHKDNARGDAAAAAAAAGGAAAPQPGSAGSKGVVRAAGMSGAGERLSVIPQESLPEDSLQECVSDTAAAASGPDRDTSMKSPFVLQAAQPCNALAAAAPISGQGSGLTTHPGLVTADSGQAPVQQQPAAANRVAATAGVAGAAAAAAASVSAAGSAGGSAGAASASGADTPVRTLVAMWKILTSYVQVLAMIRFLPSLWDAAWPLAFVDLSSFTQFAAFDCILPGPSDKLAYTRILLTAFGVPALLFATFLTGWVLRWGLGRLGAALHQAANRLEGASMMTATSGPSTQSLPSACTAANGGAGAAAAAVAGAAAAGFRSAQGQSGASLGARSDKSFSSARSVSTSSINTSAAGRSWSKAGSDWLLRSAASASMTQRLQRFGTRAPPVALSAYLSGRLTITAVVLGYSCYSLFTSSMLQILSCHPIREVADPLSTTAGEYGYRQIIRDFGTLHYQWLAERYAGLEGLGDAAGRGLAKDRPELCHQGPGRHIPGSMNATVCQVTGLYWKQDYSVQCFQGAHQVLAAFGGTFLLLAAVILPVVCGLLLWRNRGSLTDPVFTAKFSFLYMEYKTSVCWMEFAIMARKLAFLGVFVALDAPLSSPESVTLLQLYIAAVLAVGALLLNVFLQPFRNEWLNHLECAGLTATTITFLLLGASVTVSASPGGRIALLVLTAVGNCALVCYFLWHMGVIAWQQFGGVVVRFVKKIRRGPKHRRGRRRV